jgi:hypothetical protein
MKYVSAKDSLARYQSGKINGNGTLNAPFFGDLDKILRSQPPRETLQLLDGEYFLRAVEDQTDFQVRSFECLSPGLRLLGAGRRRTTLIMHSHPAASTVMFFSAHDGIEIADLTLDVAATGNEKFVRNGFVLEGSDCRVSRVGVKRVYGRAETQGEAWAIMAGNPRNEAGVITSRGQRNNRVEECLCEDFLGDYVNGISSCGARGLVRGNEIIMPDCSIKADGSFPKGHWCGLNLALHTDLICEDNSVLNGSDGVYGDTGGLDGALFRRNTIRGAWNGFRYFLDRPMRDCRFEENLIVLNGTTGGGVAFAFDSVRDFETAPGENVAITHNITRRAAGPGARLHLPLCLDHPENFRNIRFEKNFCEGNQCKGLRHVTATGNCFLDGTPLTTIDMTR